MDIPGTSSQSESATAEEASTNSWISQINQARAKIGSKFRKTTQGKPQAETVDKSLDEDLKKLLSPEFLRDYLRAPADYMLMRTGHEHWNVSDKEIDQTAIPAALVARRYCSFDPVYLAMFATGIGLIRTY